MCSQLCLYLAAWDEEITKSEFLVQRIANASCWRWGGRTGSLRVGGGAVFSCTRAFLLLAHPTSFCFHIPMLALGYFYSLTLLFWGLFFAKAFRSSLFRLLNFSYGGFLGDNGCIKLTCFVGGNGRRC